MVRTTTGHQVASPVRADHLEAPAGVVMTTGPLASLARVAHQVDGEEAVAGRLASPARVVDQVGMMDVVRGAAGPLESPGRVDINQDDLRS